MSIEHDEKGVDDVECVVESKDGSHSFINWVRSSSILQGLAMFLKPKLKKFN